MSSLIKSVVKKLEDERSSLTNKLSKVLARQQELKNKSKDLESKILEINKKIIIYHNQNN